MQTEDDVRRRLERKLGHPLRDNLWEYLVEKAYVQEVLDGYDGAWEGLVRETKKLLALTQGRTVQPARAAEEVGEGRSPGNRYLAVSFLLAHIAGTDKRVRQFRSEVLGGRLLTPAEASEWVRTQKRTRENGLYRRLEELVKGLVAFFGWGEGQAAQFVLCGTVPLASGRVQVESRGPYERARSRITITVPPWASEEEVLEAYRLARANLRLGDLRPLSAKMTSLILFVCQRLGEDGKPVGGWAALWKEWNRTYPHWKFSSWQRLCCDFRRAEKGLLHDPRTLAAYRTSVE